VARFRLEVQFGDLLKIIEGSEPQFDQTGSGLLDLSQRNSHLREKVGIARRVVRFDQIVGRTRAFHAAL